MVIKLTRDDLAIFILEVVKNDNYTHQMQFIPNENKNMLITSSSGINGKAMIMGLRQVMDPHQIITADYFHIDNPRTCLTFGDMTYRQFDF